MRRIHGAYVDEIEIQRTVDFLKGQGEPLYDETLLDTLPGLGAEGEEEDEELDELYDQAVAVIAEEGQVSISMVQRRLRIGYNRAARIVEHMEKQGVISAPDGTKSREVLISSPSSL